LVNWRLLPVVSGLECVDALRRAGFVIQASPSGIVELARGQEVIEVPLAEKLAWEALVVILHRAGIGPAAFVELLSGP
jgi:hypothetical protein